jgi:hypothetical protein
VSRLQAQQRLERRARLLLRAYPAEYRRDRAEEMIVTLLEAAPPGWSFPSARDTWSLIAGGRRARAARNGAAGAKAGLRLAVLLGLALFIGQFIGDTLTAQAQFRPGGVPLPWLWAAPLLGIAVSLAPWAGSRKVTAAVVIPVAAWLTFGLRPSGPFDGGARELAVVLTAMGALVHLSGGSPRLPRSWALLLCASPAAMVLTGGLPSAEASLSLQAELLTAAVTTCWLVTDARPAFALGLAELLGYVALAAEASHRLWSWAGLQTFAAIMMRFWLLAIIGAFMLPVTWRLRRASRARR